MRSRLFVVGVAAILAALIVPATARAAAETAPVLANQGCGALWNPGSDPDGSPTTGTSGVVNHSGSYKLSFEGKAALEANPGYVPNFCDLSIFGKSGQFEIADPNDANSYGDACLAVNTSTGFIVDDTPSACNTQEYLWDEWHAVKDGTYHSNTEWELINDWDGSAYSLTDVGGVTYWEYPDGTYEQQFVWSNSGL